jgi:hypothetical protein
MILSNKTPNTNPASTTDHLLSDTAKANQTKIKGDIKHDNVQDTSIKPGSDKTSRDCAITDANPAISGADPVNGQVAGEQEPGLSS